MPGPKISKRRSPAQSLIRNAARSLLKQRRTWKVQRSIDGLYLRRELASSTSIDFIRWIHEQFYAQMPEEFRFVSRPDGTKVEIIPGEFRKSEAEEVTVGRHRPPSSTRVLAFMEYFSRRYDAAAKGASTRILAIASAHHRFNYVHPFPDGNGRVSRLMSHAMALQGGIGGQGLWSISRGLARGLKDRGEYKQMMDYADSPRRGERDGRGNLSETALQNFVSWFLAVALDQVRFSATLFDLDRLEDRYRGLISDLSDDKRAPDLISAVLKQGSLSRGDANLVLRTSERTARNSLAGLVRQGFLKSDSPKASVRIAFPLDYRERLFPNLFTEAEIPVPEPPAITFR
jgi:Fic family protein